MLKKIVILIFIVTLLTGCSTVKKLFFLEPDLNNTDSTEELETADNNLPFIIGTMAIYGEPVQLSQSILNLSVDNDLVAFDGATVCLSDPLNQNDMTHVNCTLTNIYGAYILHVPNLNSINKMMVSGFKQTGNQIQVVSNFININLPQINANPRTTAATVLALELIKNSDEKQLPKESQELILNDLNSYATHLMTSLESKSINEFSPLTMFSWNNSIPFTGQNVSNILTTKFDTTEIVNLKNNFDANTKTIALIIKESIQNHTQGNSDIPINKKISGKVSFPNTINYTGTLVCPTNLFNQKIYNELSCVYTDSSGNYEIMLPDDINGHILIAGYNAIDYFKFVSVIIDYSANYIDITPYTTLASSLIVNDINAYDNYLNNDFILLNPNTAKSILNATIAYENSLLTLLQSRSFSNFDSINNLAIDASYIANNIIKNIPSLFQLHFTETESIIDSNLTNDIHVLDTKKTFDGILETIETTSIAMNALGSAQSIQSVDSSLLSFGHYLATISADILRGFTKIFYESVVVVADGNKIHVSVPAPPVGLQWVHHNETNELILYGTPQAEGSYTFSITFTDISSGATISKEFKLKIDEGTNSPPESISINPIISSLPENTSIVNALPVGSIQIEDDGLGTNYLNITGEDAQFFELNVLDQSLNLKPGTLLDYEGVNNSYNIIIELQDDSFSNEFSVTTSFSLLITDNNEAPIINHSHLDLKATENESYSFQFDVVDPDLNNQFVANLSGMLPPGLSFNASTLQLSGTPTIGSSGIYPINLIVEDLFGLSQNMNFQFIIHAKKYEIINSFAHNISTPKAFVLDDDSNQLYVINNESGESTLFKIDTNLSSQVSLGTLLFRANDITFGETKNELFISSRTDGNIYKLQLLPWEITHSALPGGINQKIDFHNNTLYIAQTDNCFIQQVNFSLSKDNPNYITTIAGQSGYCSSANSDGQGLNAKFSYIKNIALNANHSHLYIADNNKLRIFNLNTHMVSTISSTELATFNSLVVNLNNQVYAGNNSVKKIAYYSDTYIADTIVDSSLLSNEGIIDMALSDDGQYLYILDSYSIHKIALP